jgi:hypothetical protein
MLGLNGGKREDTLCMATKKERRGVIVKPELIAVSRRYANRHAQALTAMAQGPKLPRHSNKVC